MWNSTKSAKLSLICTRIVMVMVVAFAVLLPRLISQYGDTIKGMIDQNGITTLMVILYLCCIPAAVALICLDRLLFNIAKENIFDSQNVKYLRLISWSCFFAAGLCVVAGRYYVLFLAVAIAAGFMGLILRVVKNVIQSATEIKEENDFTI